MTNPSQLIATPAAAARAQAVGYPLTHLAWLVAAATVGQLLAGRVLSHATQQAETEESQQAAPDARLVGQC